MSNELILNEITTTFENISSSFRSEYIKSIHDASIEFDDINKIVEKLGLSNEFRIPKISRLVIRFYNGYKLSVIASNSLFEIKKNNFELAIVDPINTIIDEHFEDEPKYNGFDVLHNCTADDIKRYIEKIGSIKTKPDEQEQIFII